MIGFGSYRINTTNAQHEQALKLALANGITLIDTSTNYGNGQSEQLIGRVINARNSDAGNSNADNSNANISNTENSYAENSAVQVVTKVGYIQGDLHDFALAHEAMGNPFQDVVKLSDGLWHCIHPDFLEAVLEQSFARLQTPHVHAVLLHNPEYFLQLAFKESKDVDESRTEMYRRIALAFEYLESLVVKGLISAYGISSNTFVADAQAYDHVSLEKCIEIARAIAETSSSDSVSSNSSESAGLVSNNSTAVGVQNTSSSVHNFKYAQFPFNLLENDAVLCKNQSDGTMSTLDVARANNMFVMGNRPLNAFVDGELIRLATHVLPGQENIADLSDFAQEIETTIHALELVEHEVTQDVIRNANVDAEEQPKVHEAFRIASALCSAWNTFQGKMHWEDVRRAHLDTRLQTVTEYVDRMSDPASLLSYIESISALLDQLSLLYTADENESLDSMRERLTEIFSLPSTTPLQHIAIHAVNHTQGVGAVLVGMRTPQYVRDVLQCAQLPPSTYDEQTWEKVREALVELSAEE
ncbi:MAG: aldo/keto reductase [Ignavibacteria bacterium]|nr:aldo/keto reductase [Ignavibacteria bacterium]